MIKWPNIGLAGELLPCDENNLRDINNNLFLIDTLLNASFVGFVDSSSDLPTDPENGDAYIAIDTNLIHVFKETSWIELQPQTGWTAGIKEENALYLYDGTSWNNISGLSGKVDKDILQNKGDTFVLDENNDIIPLSISDDGMNRIFDSDSPNGFDSVFDNGKVESKTANYTADARVRTYLGDTTAGNISATLPDPALVPNLRWTFFKTNSANSFTVKYNSSFERVLSADGEFLTIISDGAKYIQIKWNKQPTVTRLTSGSGTYTVTNGCKRLFIEMVGGGGGGGGSGNSNSGGIGGTGGTTTFGSSLLTCTGGAGGSSGISTGGSATVNSPAVNKASQSGSAGQGVNQQTLGSQGGQGGVSPFGGAGGGNFTAGNGGGAAPNSGSGGGGAGGPSTGQPGGGGASGGFIDAMIVSPSSTYAYSIGSGGTAGSAGTSGFGGGAGGSGIIIITEYYD